MIKNIYCVGGATIDHKLKPINALIPATSNPATSHTTYGGVARNVAENLIHWTQNIYLQCVVGEDEYGKHLLTHLQAQGVNIRNSFILPNQATAHYYAVLTQQGDLHIALVDMDIYNHLPDNFIYAWEAWEKQSIAFVDTNLPTHMLEYACKLAAEKQIVLCVDPISIAKAKKLPVSLHGIFLLKPNKLEASALTDVPIHSIKDCITAGKKLLARGVANVVISLGAEGYVVINAMDALHVKVENIPTIVDANGAGDAFIAGILYGLQQDVDIFHACQFGAAAAALTIQSEKSVADTITVADIVSDEKLNIKDKQRAAIF